MAARSNGRADTPARKRKFLDAFAELLTITKAANKAGLARSTVYEWRKDDAKFAEEWDQIDEEITESLEREAYRRAVEGFEKPIFSSGREVGRVRQYSDRLLEMLLRARRPEKYRDRVSVTDEREEERKRELERASETDLDKALTGVDDNVVPLRKAS